MRIPDDSWWTVLKRAWKKLDQEEQFVVVVVAIVLLCM